MAAPFMTTGARHLSKPANHCLIEKPDTNHATCHREAVLHRRGDPELTEVKLDLALQGRKDLYIISN